LTAQKPTPELLSKEPPRGNPDIPPKHLKYALESFKPEIWKNIYNWLTDSEEWSMYITGGLGSGKSCLVAALLDRYRRLLRYGNPPQLRGRFVPPYVFTRIAKAFTNSGHIWNMWIHTELLVLDDVGSARDTGWVTEQLLHLLEQRYDYQRPTILTSNMSLQDLSEHVDPRAASRLAEGGQMNLGNVDARRKKIK
jgi:DNA replication protein DnaC